MFLPRKNVMKQKNKIKHNGNRSKKFYAFSLSEDDPQLCPVCDGIINEHSKVQVTECYNFLCKGCKEDAART